MGLGVVCAAGHGVGRFVGARVGLIVGKELVGILSTNILSLSFPYVTSTFVIMVGSPPSLSFTAIYPAGVVCFNVYKPGDTDTKNTFPL